MLSASFNYLKMEFAVDSFALCIDHLESVRAIAVHEAVAVGCATIGEQKGHLVSSFRAQSNKIPKHIWIYQYLKTFNKTFNPTDT